MSFVFFGFSLAIRRWHFAEDPLRNQCEHICFFCLWKSLTKIDK